VVRKPEGVNPFEFIAVSVLRTRQLLRGCTPRIAGSHKATVMAQMEVSAGMVHGAFGAAQTPARIPETPAHGGSHET
jgi:hypothetical protein